MNQMLPAPALIFIHGIGNQNPDWIQEVTKALPLEYQNRCVSFFWADLFNDSPAGKVAGTLVTLLETFTPALSLIKGATPQTAIFAGIQYVAVPWLKKLFDYSGDVLAYSSVRQKAFQRLEALIQAQNGPVVLVAHSMGTVLAFEFLQKPSSLRDAVQHFISLGSPLERQPIRAQVLARNAQATQVPCPWLNLWGSLDLVCSWIPWRSGALDVFQPTEQIKLRFQGHHLGAYVQRIPLDWLV